jgi:hypothetical protein
MEIDETQELILTSITVTLLAVGALAWFAHWLHQRTRRDAQDNISSVHLRLDRERNDDRYGIERIRTALAELRRDFLEWWRKH